MRFPYQTIGLVQPSESRSNRGFLLATCGARLMSTNLDHGKVVSEWPENPTLQTARCSCSPRVKPQIAPIDENGESERPKKKLKTSGGSMNQAPNFIKLAVSDNQQYVTCVTDDKVVHVFQISPDGSLSSISQRTMPKRPCAMQILPDNSTILCGDKFGDVYSLPLLLPDETSNPATTTTDDISFSDPAKAPFKPSATTLTVHTQRNRKALSAQLAQKNLTPRKEPLKFPHKLLLGHVSMLTDLCYAEMSPANVVAKEFPSGARAGYIITADRDEHIRISRGPPQTHVIEGYCLGHTEYVSKICLAGEDSGLLLSGGGDDWVGIWSWCEEDEHGAKGRMYRKVDLKQKVREVLEARDGGTEAKVNVSGIWRVRAAMLVAVERVPALFMLDHRHLRDEQVEFLTFPLETPPLDVVSADDLAIVSLDSREKDQTRLEAFTIAWEQNKLLAKPDEIMQKRLQSLNEMQGETKIQPKELDELLFGVANLRKRGPGLGEAAEDEAGADD